MINVIGLGYIGLPTALMMASHGVEVIGTDYNKELVDIGPLPAVASMISGIGVKNLITAINRRLRWRMLNLSTRPLRTPRRIFGLDL